MIGLSNDPWLQWATTCDHFRSRIAGLPAAAGCFVFPSVEAATLELGLLLADREREVGGTRTQIIYGYLQDPALDRMAKSLSATGLDTQPKTSKEFSDIATWFGDVKAKALLVATAEDDRFSAAVHDVQPFRAAVFSDGVRVPTLSLNFGSRDWRTTLPKPFEMRVYEIAIADGFTTLVVAGERLRFEPRMAPLVMDSTRLKAIEVALISSQLAPVDAPEVLSAHSEKARHDIEAFEAALPKPFRAWWPLGSSRLLDRAVVTCSEHDGSWIIEQLIPKLAAAGISLPRIHAGLFSLSGCVMGDERRQEWLRLRGEDAWLVRGAIHISLDLIRAIPQAHWAFPTV